MRRQLPTLFLGLVLAGCQSSESAPVGVATQRLSETPAAFYVVLDAPPAAALVAPGADPGDPATVRRVRRHLADLEAARDALRPLLLAEGATVIAELSRLTNAFHVHLPPSLVPRVASFPGVLRVEPVPTYQLDLGTALSVVAAPAAWSSERTGQGIRLGIIDSGIDYLHAAFGGTGGPAAYAANDRSVIEPGTFPTARVVGGWDFAGDAYNPSGGSMVPSPDPDPLDCGGGHGSHVAGIAASGGVLGDGSPFSGPYSQSFVAADFRVPPGVAPEAQLYAIKIFGCSGSTQLFASGLDWAADPDQDGDFSDRLDVVNASLGTSFGLASPVTDAAVENLAALGTLVVAAAGNEGATFFALSSPARAPSVLAVAATVESGLVSLHVTAPSALSGTFGAAEGIFTLPLATSGPVSAAMEVAQPVQACAPLTNEVAGKIALIERGTCAFVDKIAHAQAAGAVAVVVANHNLGEAPFAMSGTGAASIPAVMIGMADGQKLFSASGVALTLDAAPFSGPGAEAIAGLSSRGPSVQARLKPEIAAPGAGIESVQVGSGSQASNKSGTSMAAPFVAGAAALVRQGFPALGPSEVKAMLINNAVPIANIAGHTYPVTMQGAGRLDVAAALAECLTVADAEEPEAVGVSFGAFVVSEPVTVSRQVVVSNHDDEPLSLATAAEQLHPIPGVTVSASPAIVDVPAGGQASVTLTLAIDPALLGDAAIDPVTSPTQFDLPRHALLEADGILTLSGPASAKLPFYAVVRAAGEQNVAAGTSCSDTRLLALEGPSAHPRPVVSAFELGLEHPEAPGSGPSHLDLRAIGVTSNVAQSKEFDEVSLFFAVVVGGAWTTPAVAELPSLAVEIDVDEDGLVDFMIVPEPLGRDAPFADVLTATTYAVSGCNGFNLEQCQQIDRKRYLNGLPADVAPTHPFFNGALVLPVYASDLGLSDDQATLRYRAVTRTITGPAEQTAWASFDALSPELALTSGGIREGMPFFDGPIVVGGSSSPLLVIHHANVIGQHWEIVDVATLSGAPLALALSSADSVAAGERLLAKVVVENDGEASLSEVAVSLSVTGGVIDRVEAKSGSCQATKCTFASVPAGAIAEIEVELVASAAVALSATASTAEGCQLKKSLEVPLAVPVVAPPPPPALVPSGGCGCRLAADEGQGGFRGWLLALAFAGLGLRRRLGRVKARPSRAG